ncbi:hypothetical protein AYI69_g3026, partial [Smittium culicis]
MVLYLSQIPQNNLLVGGGGSLHHLGLDINPFPR